MNDDNGELPAIDPQWKKQKTRQILLSSVCPTSIQVLILNLLQQWAPIAFKPFKLSSTRSLTLCLPSHRPFHTSLRLSLHLSLSMHRPSPRPFFRCSSPLQHHLAKKPENTVRRTSTFNPTCTFFILTSSSRHPPSNPVLPPPSSPVQRTGRARVLTRGTSRIV